MSYVKGYLTHRSRVGDDGGGGDLAGSPVSLGGMLIIDIVVSRGCLKIFSSRIILKIFTENLSLPGPAVVLLITRTFKKKKKKKHKRNSFVVVIKGGGNINNNIDGEKCINFW